MQGNAQREHEGSFITKAKQIFTFDYVSLCSSVPNNHAIFLIT